MITEACPQYDLTTGITLVRERYETQAQDWELLGSIPLSGKLLTDITAEAVASEPERQTLARGTSRLGIAAWQRGDEALLHFDAWGANTEHPVGEHVSRCFAGIFSDMSLASYSQPGHGSRFLSTPWPQNVRRGFRRGSFLPAGEYVASFYRQLEIADGSLHVAGTSMGGRVAIGVASALRRPVENLVVFDPPGSRTFSLPRFAYRFARTEHQHANRYLACSQDAILRERELAGRRRIVADMYADYRRGALTDYYWREPQALAQAGLAADLRLADFSGVRRLAYVFPAHSALHSVAALRESLRVGANKHTETEFELWTFCGTHGFGLAGGSAIARLFEAVIRTKG